MLFSLPYTSFANYSPRGQTETSRKSKGVCGAVKRGTIPLIDDMINHFTDPNCRIIVDAMNESVLVPVPRSSPIQHGTLWPSAVIANRLIGAGYGIEVKALIRRATAIQKSAYASQGSRPTVEEHMATLEVEADLLGPKKIMLIDDVITMGTTSMACALKLQEVYQSAEIMVFSIMRTQGFKDNIESLIDPSEGVVKYFSSGKVFRDP